MNKKLLLKPIRYISLVICGLYRAILYVIRKQLIQKYWIIKFLNVVISIPNSYLSLVYTSNPEGEMKTLLVYVMTWLLPLSTFIL